MRRPVGRRPFLLVRLRSERTWAARRSCCVTTRRLALGSASSRAAVVANERVLALPEFRPKIALISGLHLDLSGGTQVVLKDGAAPKSGEPAAKADPAASPATAAAPATPAAPAGTPVAASPGSEIPTLEVVYGRIVLINPTNGENRVRLKLGSSVGEASLVASRRWAWRSRPNMCQVRILSRCRAAGMPALCARWRRGVEGRDR